MIYPWSIKAGRRLYALITVILCCSLLSIFYPALAAQATEGKVIRIHVLAHNDTPEEQEIKLAVRDKVLLAVGALVAEAATSEEAEDIVAANLNTIRNVAEEQVRSMGLGHLVSLQWGRFVFPSRVYGRTALPAGSYQALNVVIGEGQGRNWWCIMYPPLCYVDGVVQRGNETTYQFALVNLLRSIWHKIRP
jgi:stage II sporulation protein R